MVLLCGRLSKARRILIFLTRKMESILLSFAIFREVKGKVMCQE